MSQSYDEVMGRVRNAALFFDVKNKENPEELPMFFKELEITLAADSTTDRVLYQIETTPVGKKTLIEIPVKWEKNKTTIIFDDTNFISGLLVLAGTTHLGSPRRSELIRVHPVPLDLSGEIKVDGDRVIDDESNQIALTANANFDKAEKLAWTYFSEVDHSSHVERVIGSAEGAKCEVNYKPDELIVRDVNVQFTTTYSKEGVGLLAHGAKVVKLRKALQAHEDGEVIYDVRGWGGKLVVGNWVIEDIRYCIANELDWTSDEIIRDPAATAALVKEFELDRRVIDIGNGAIYSVTEFPIPEKPAPEPEPEPEGEPWTELEPSTPIEKPEVGPEVEA